VAASLLYCSQVAKHPPAKFVGSPRRAWTARWAGRRLAGRGL